MQLCEECGAELPDNAVFCGHCGRKTTSEDEIVTNENSAPTEDISISPSEIAMTLNDSEDSTLENGEEEKQQTPDFPSEMNAEEEEQTSYLTTEHLNEEQEFFLASEKHQNQHSPYTTSEDENEEQMHQEYYESTSSMPGDTDSEAEILTNQLPDEELQYTQTPLAPKEMQSPYASDQKSESRSVSRCLLFSLAGLVIIAGVVVALLSLFHINFPGSGESSSALSSSSDNEIINPTASSLTASICINSSTPSSSVANQGSTFTLVSSSGCSTVIASKVNSSCLIFPITTDASRKYIVDVSNASIDSNSYHLVLGIVNYAGSTTYNDAQHISVGLSEGSTGQNFSWFYHSGSVTINNGEQSGTLDVVLRAVNGGNTLHLVGDWACGHQIKNS